MIAEEMTFNLKCRSFELDVSQIKNFK